MLEYYGLPFFGASSILKKTIADTASVAAKTLEVPYSLVVKPAEDFILHIPAAYTAYQRGALHHIHPVGIGTYLNLGPVDTENKKITRHIEAAFLVRTFVQGDWASNGVSSELVLQDDEIYARLQTRLQIPSYTVYLAILDRLADMVEHYALA
jgi:hypothetical protein